jgi:sec-independent protein translocase protein TatC
VLIAIFVIAAILTPPDAVSQCIMAIPMYLLYEGGIIMARIMQGMRRKDADSADTEGSDA